MKCIYCGEELKDESLFCSKCGKAVQIVPDYNVYDDDYLNEVLAREAASAKKQTAQREQQQKKQKQKIALLVGSVLAVLVFALVVFAAAIRSNHANSYDYQVRMAQKAEASGDTKNAISYYENALALDSGSTDVKLSLAALYEKEGDTDEAIRLYQEVLQADAANRAAALALIDIYEELGSTDEIVALRDTVDESLSGLFAAYTVEMPQFSLESGTYEETQTLSIVSPSSDVIYYTLDGSEPETDGLPYAEPIALDENETVYTVKAVCRNENGVYSAVATAEYTISIPAPDTPIVTPDGGDFGVETTVTVTVPDGCSAYYTWDGSTPGTYSSLYTEPMTIPEGNNVLSVILVDNSTGLSSDVFCGNYIYYSTDVSGEDAEADADTDTDAQE